MRVRAGWFYGALIGALLPTAQIGLRPIRRVGGPGPGPATRIPAVAPQSTHSAFPVERQVSIPGLGWRSRGATPVRTRFTPPGGQTVASTAGNPSVRTRWKDVLDCFGRCRYPRRRRPLISCRREAFASREQPMRVLKAVIAEDEPVLRAELKDTLLRLWPELVVSGEAEDGFQALQALDKHAPDILFLDIQ